MRSLFGHLLLVTVLCGPQLVFGETAEEAWSAFKTTYDRIYASPEAEQHRRQVFFSNFDIIERHNAEFDAGRSTYRLGVNQFADMTNEEFRKTLLSSSRRRSVQKSGRSVNVETSRSSAAPDHFDWREQGVPITIKSQGQSDDALTFASADSVRYGYFITTHQSVYFSRQNLRDCAGKHSVINNLLYVKKHGLADETQYPETGGAGPCQHTAIRATVGDVIEVTDADEDALVDALLQSPAAVEIDASRISFQLYSSGIYDDPDCDSTRVDHAVVLVGYGVSSSVEYWTIANSWGSGWGDRGYMKMKRGSNLCGIASYAGVPIDVNPA